MRNEINSRLKNPFLIPFLLTLTFAAIELLGGVWTQSLALLSDAWHMLSDVFALGLAAVAARKANNQNKAELLVSIINAALMLVVIVWIVIEAVERFNNPRLVASDYVMMIAFIGLVINLIVVKQLHQYEGEKGLNHQAAFLHVVGDVLGSLAALLAGAIIYLTGWLPIDALLSMFIAFLLFIGTVNLIKNIYFDITNQDSNTHHHGHHH